ncbi:hypothetical protein FACS1894199_18210 [Bacteroidia bacterium]|nr:hypothetical protein FACS1894199_18210 [Bacteroidia bacterium]
MRKITIILCAALLVTVCASCTKSDRNIFATLHGVVSDHETGDPIATASVVLSPSGKTKTTGSDGRYEFDDLDAAQYTITVQKIGYQTNRKTITAVSGESAEANIPLTKNN